MPTPNPSLRREYKGAAAATTLQNSMTNADTTFVLVSNTNWPTGAVGKFIVTINRGQADEEKILCDSQSARTVASLLANRGFDGTTAQSHAAGATVECTISAFDADEWNQHTNATGAVHGVAGSVVGTTDTQTLTNKTLTSPTVGGVVTETGVHSPDTSGHVGLTVKGLSGQSVDLQQWQDNTAAPLVKVDSFGSLWVLSTNGGRLFVGSGSDLGADACFSSTATGAVVVAVRGIASQSGDLQQWQNSTPTIVAKIDANGNIFATNLTSAWTAYTPTFTNCTSPTGNFAYNLVGKTLYIRGTFTGGTATAAGQIQISLPAGLTSAVTGTSVVSGIQGTTAIVPWTTSHATTMTTNGTAFTLGQALANLAFTGVIEVA